MYMEAQPFTVSVLRGGSEMGFHGVIIKKKNSALKIKFNTCMPLTKLITDKKLKN